MRRAVVIAALSFGSGWAGAQGSLPVLPCPTDTCAQGNTLIPGQPYAVPLWPAGWTGTPRFLFCVPRNWAGYVVQAGAVGDPNHGLRVTVAMVLPPAGTAQVACQNVLGSFGRVAVVAFPTGWSVEGKLDAFRATLTGAQGLVGQPSVLPPGGPGPTLVAWTQADVDAVRAATQQSAAASQQTLQAAQQTLQAVQAGAASEALTAERADQLAGVQRVAAWMAAALGGWLLGVRVA